MRTLTQLRLELPAAFALMVLLGSSTPVAAQFNYPVGDSNGSGWLENRHGLWWLDLYDYGGNCGAAYHPGIDFNQDGTSGDQDRYQPVYATAPGVVIAAAKYGSTWGNIVVIEHTLGNGSKVWSVYGHLEDFTVSVNNVIPSNRTQIGRVGKGDGSLAAHLHFEIRKVQQTPSSFPCGQTAAWVEARYHDPILFVNDHRSGVPVDRSLIKTAGSDTVYWQQNNRHYPIVSGAVIDTMQAVGMPGWSWSQITTVSSLPGAKGPNFINTDAASNGLLLRQVGTQQVFLVENGRRRPFVSGAALSWQGQNWFGNVIDVSMGLLDSFTTGLGNYIYEVGEGDSATVKSAIAAKYAQNAGDPYCSAAVAADSNLRTWASRGWPGNFSACLGFPMNPVFSAGASAVSGSGGRYQNFGNDSTRYGIIVQSDRGTYAIWGAIFAKWAAMNFQGGCLGFPISDERASDNNRITDFEGGSITWFASTNTTTAVCGSATTRVIALSGNLAFGTVPVGSSATRTLTISNSGNSPLVVSGISLPFGFTGNWSGTIAAGGSQPVPIMFAPTQPASYGGTVTVNANDTSGTNTTSASGTGTATTCTFAVSPTSVTLGNLAAQGTITVTTQPGCEWTVVSHCSFLTFQNGANRSGTGPLSFSVSTNSTLNPRTCSGTVAGKAFNVTQSAAPKLRLAPDLDGDGDVDLIWQNRSQGYIAAWRMNDLTLSSSDLFSPARVTDPNWRIAATADMDGDGQLDLIWQEETQGWIGIWKMNGLALVSSLAISIERVPDPDWKIVAAQDFNGDGKADIVWHHRTQGYIALWYMNGVTVVDSVLLSPGQVTDTNWRIEAVADFNSDGKPDLLWRHQTAGWVTVWLMNGLTMTSGRDLSPNRVADTNWRIASVADVNRDNMPDIIWHDVVNGWIGVWLMNGTSLLSSVAFTPERVADVNWRIVGPK